MNVLFKHVDFGSRELASADALFEQDVELGEGAACRLRKAEEGVYDAAEADAGPEEAGVVAPVPSTRVEHVRREDTTDDSYKKFQSVAMKT